VLLSLLADFLGLSDVNINDFIAKTQYSRRFITKTPGEISSPFSASPRIAAPIGVDLAGFAALETCRTM